MSLIRPPVGVAISTTGDLHRMEFLETAVARWSEALRTGDRLFVTVDGDARVADRVAERLRYYNAGIYRVGQSAKGDWFYSGRLGVAVNKNTGLELLIDRTDVEHLFLSDDDTWPIYPQALSKHIDLHIPHSMVCWGKHRVTGTDGPYTTWSWPRGAMMYVKREVVWSVGGMDERFGPGGHEHVEWSNRIHNAGFTPAPYCSPASYATRNATGAAAVWSCEDMPKRGEPLGNHRARRRAITSIVRTHDQWIEINKIMASCEGKSEYVSFRAHENGRASATLCENNQACAVEPATPRSEK